MPSHRVEAGRRSTDVREPQAVGDRGQRGGLTECRYGVPPTFTPGGGGGPCRGGAFGWGLCPTPRSPPPTTRSAPARPSRSPTSSPSPGTAPPSSSTAEALAAIDRARAVVEELAAAPTPAYGISTGFGALATRHIPTEMRAQLQRSLVRSHAAGSGPEVEREVVRGADAAAALDAGDRPHRRTPGDGAAAGRLLIRTASRRWCTSTARSAAPATSRRWRTARWR